MNRRVVPLPLIPLAAPVQLVLGLPVGIRPEPKRRRRALWLPPRERAA